jgi:hypothetical protein
LTSLERDYIVEMAFIRMFLAWEDFLEESFIRYMRGARRSKGQQARPLTTVTSLDQARRVVAGERRRYADWYDPATILERARLHLKDGEPYASAIGPAMTHLDRMRIIRNRIAHRSQWALQQFTQLLRDLYGSTAHQTPGRVLLAQPSQSALPATGGPQGSTLMDLYAAILRAAAAQIVP